MSKAKKAQKKVRPTFRRMNISPELHAAWKNHKRPGDELLIAEKLGISKYTAQNALSYGFVQREEVVTGITKFFADRFAAETDAAKKLLKK